MSKPVVIVTGASKGIGQAIVKKLLESATVIGVSRSEGPLQALANEHSNFRYIAGDIANEETSKKALDAAIGEFKRLDGIVFNAGVLEPVTKLADASTEDWKRLFDVNFFSILSLVQLSIPALRQSKGRVVFLSSGAAKSHYQAWGAYGSSKAAMDHLCGTLSAEEQDIFSIAVAPGVVDTGMQANIRDLHQEAMGASHDKFVQLKQTGSLLQPEHPAGIISNLVLKGSGSDLNGKSLRFNDDLLKSYVA